MPGTLPGSGDTAADKTVPALGKFTFQWSRKIINKQIYSMRAGGISVIGRNKAG